MSKSISYLKDFKSRNKGNEKPRKPKIETPRIWIDDLEYKKAAKKMIAAIHEAQDQLEILKKIIFKKGRDTDNAQARLFCEFFGALLKAVGMFKL
jgi:hypothetical protein